LGAAFILSNFFKTLFKSLYQSIMKRKSVIIFTFLVSVVFSANVSYAFWIWTPKSKTMINPKFAVKDTPREQYDWAMRFYELHDFQRAADEFVRLVNHYPDSDLAPDAQYYAGRSFEELGKYYFAYENYQKTVEKYPYTKRMEEILQREFNIAKILQTKDEPKLMDMELSLSMDRAVTIYKKIVENSPFGEYADKSLYNMADCYRRLKRYNEAAEAYRKIINDHPGSDLVPEAKYQLAYTMYEASLDPEYDQASTEEALEEFERIAKTSDIPGISEEADKAILELKDKKAKSIMTIAEFYERQKKYGSALLYYKEIARDYPGTPSANIAEIKIEILSGKVKN